MGLGDGIAISDLSAKAREGLKEAGVNTGRDNNPNDLSAADVSGALAGEAGVGRSNIAKKIARALVEGSSEKRDKIISAQGPDVARELTSAVSEIDKSQRQVGTWIRCTGSDSDKLSEKEVSPALVSQLKRVAELGYSLKLEGSELSIIGPLKSMSMWVEPRGQEGMTTALERYLNTVKDINVSDAAAKLLDDKSNGITLKANGVMSFTRNYRAQGFQEGNYIYQLEFFNEDTQVGAGSEKTKGVEITADKTGRLNLDVELDNGSHQRYSIDPRSKMVINETAPKLEVESDIQAKLEKSGIEVRNNKLFFPEGYVYYQDREALSSKTGFEPEYIDPFSKEEDNGEPRAAVISAELKASGRNFALTVTLEGGQTERYLINPQKGYVLRESSAPQLVP